MRLKEYIGTIAERDMLAMALVERQIRTISEANSLSRGIEHSLDPALKDLLLVPIKLSQFEAALTYRIALIGEDVKTLPEATKKAYPDAPWRKLPAIRNLVAHEVKNIWEFGEDAYLKKLETHSFTDREQVALSQFMNDHFKSKDPLLHRIAVNIFVSGELTELTTNHTRTGQEIANTYKGRTLADVGSLGQKTSYVTPPLNKLELLGNIFGDLNFFNFTKLSESLAFLSPMFMKIHGESEVAKNNLPDPEYATKFRNHTLHNSLDTLSSVREKKPALKVAHEVFGKAIVNLSHCIESYMSPYSSKNKVSINTESYFNTPIKFGSDKKSQVSFSDMVGAAKVTAIEKALSHFFQQPDEQRNRGYEQAYVLSLAHLSKNMSEKNFKELVDGTYNNLDKLASQIRLIDGSKAGFSAAEAGRRVGNLMRECLGNSVNKQ